MIFYNEEQAIQACSEEPSLIFNLIKDGYYDVVDKILSLGVVNVNTYDDMSNDVIVRLLKARQYDLVLKHMKNEEWDVNHQNFDGNTFAHVLVTFNYIHVTEIIRELRRNRNFKPNIKNYKNETILDRSIQSKCLYTSMKILEDWRFNSIDITSFKKLYNAYIKNSYYGKYSKLNNLEVIVDKLGKKKQLLPGMRALLNSILSNMELIKNDLLVNKSSNLECIIDSYMEVV